MIELNHVVHVYRDVDTWRRAERKGGEETPHGSHACEYKRGRVSVETIIIQAGIT